MIYARDVHQRFPTGDVVVSERDLAEQLRKRPEAIVTALNLLLYEQKVQRAPLSIIARRIAFPHEHRVTGVAVRTKGGWS